MMKFYHCDTITLWYLEVTRQLHTGIADKYDGMKSTRLAKQTCFKIESTFSSWTAGNAIHVHDWVLLEESGAPTRMLASLAWLPFKSMNWWFDRNTGERGYAQEMQTNFFICLYYIASTSKVIQVASSVSWFTVIAFISSCPSHTPLYLGTVGTLQQGCRAKG